MSRLEKQHRHDRTQVAPEPAQEPGAERTSPESEEAAARLAAAQFQEYAYPHRDRIEASFGRPIGAHAFVDPSACETIDAEAYRAGDRVVFDSPTPTLHTAAHEAAHALAGADEATADRAANAVVAGRSAAAFLSTGSAAAAPVVQAKKKKSPVVFVGMNDVASGEAGVLRTTNADAGGVEAIINDPKAQDQFKDAAGVVHDLNDDASLEALVGTWGISEAQEEAVVKLVKATGSNTKDEVFKLARVYSEAELGKRTMERIVLSGHSIGGEIFGQGAWMSFDVLVALKEIFPKAAGGVRHVMLSACSSGYESSVTKYQEAFPGLKTVWGYPGVSPSGAGARADIASWEGKTDDPGEERIKPPRKGVATWSESKGYEGGDAMTFAEALAEVEGMESEFQAHFEGTKEVTSSSGGPIYTYYRSLQRLLGKPELVGDARAKWQARMQVAVRLRFWPEIRGKFGAEYGARLKKGYDAIKRAMPEFGKITRAAALAELAAFASEGNADSADAQALLQGLRDLDEKTIKGDWL